MKCELCHKAEARHAVTTKVDGVDKELYVCRSCAQRLNPRTKASLADEQGPSQPDVKVVDVNGDDAPPIVEELVKATLGFMKDVAEKEENDNRRCPGCNRTWEEVSKVQRLSCPRCWKTFASQIREKALFDQYGPTHVGAAPAADSLPTPKESRLVLERELKKAVKREDYRLAAEIKRKLDGLEGKESPDEPS